MARIAFFLPDFRGGGAEQVALTLIDGLAARGHEIDLVLCHADGVLLKRLPQGVQVVDLSASRIRRSLRPLIQYLRRRRPDAVQASMWPLTIVAIVATKLAGVGNRVVVSEHSALSKEYAQKGWATYGLLEFTIRALFPLASARVAVSNGVRGDLASLGVPEQTIDVIANPIRSVAHEAAEPICWPSTGLKVLTVGNLVPAKNQMLLLDAFAEVSKQVDCSLLICGEGEMRGALHGRVRELGLEDKVLMPGFVEDVGGAYRTADLFVLASDWEGYSLVLVEALQAGLPVVATDCDHGPREILDGGRYGRLVPVGDTTALAAAIIAALRTPSDPDALRQRASELRGEESVDRYEQLLLRGEEAR